MCMGGGGCGGNTTTCSITYWISDSTKGTCQVNDPTGGSRDCTVM